MINIYLKTFWTSITKLRSSSFTFLLLLTTFNTHSQVTFQIAFGGSDYDVSHMMMQLTSNGTYIFTGETYSFGAGADDIYTAEISSSGTVLWSKTYGTSGSERSNCIRETRDGGYIIAGMKSVGGGGNDVCLIKTDASGNLMWTRTYGGVMSEEPNSVRQTSDGGYIVAGLTANYTSTQNLEIYVIKTDTFGVVQWTHTYGVNGFLGDEGRDILETPDFNFIILGQTSTPGLTDIALVKISKSLGTVMWAKRYNFFSYDQPTTLELTPDHGFIVTGYASTGANEDIFLMKTDSAGVVQWSKTYGDAYSNRGWGVTNTFDGGFAVTGSWHAAVLTGEDMYVLKTDAGGTMQFLKTLGTTQDDLGYIIRQIPSDSGYAISGITCCGGVGPGDRDFILSKTDKQGNIIGTCNLLVPSMTTTNMSVSGVPMTLIVNTFGTSAIPSLAVLSPPTQEVILCSAITLPIELLEFQAKPAGNEVLLSWSTGTEINNDYFTIERSPDGLNFETAGEVNGSGNSSMVHNYGFTDPNPFEGVSYYRLKQTDYDGTFTNSPVIAVSISHKETIYIFPNPAHDIITLKFPKQLSSIVCLTISDPTGRMVYNRNIEAKKVSEVKLALQEIPCGVYSVSCRTEEQTLINKLVIE